jgi:hypothetical protein
MQKNERKRRKAKIQKETRKEEGWKEEKKK